MEWYWQGYNGRRTRATASSLTSNLIWTGLGWNLEYALRNRCLEAWTTAGYISARDHLKYDGTPAETRFRLSAKRTSPFTSAGGRQSSRLLAAEVCASAVVMLDTPCSEVV